MRNMSEPDSVVEEGEDADLMYTQRRVTEGDMLEGSN